MWEPGCLGERSPSGSSGCMVPAAELAGRPSGLPWLVPTGARLAGPRRLGAVGLDHAWHGEREGAAAAPACRAARQVDGCAGLRALATPASPAHPQWVTVSRSPSRHLLPPFLPAAAARRSACKALSSHGGARWGQAAIAPLQSPAEALGEGTALRPSFCFPTGRHFPPWLEGTEVLTRRGTVQAWCWGPGWGVGLVPSPSLASSARGGLPPPPGKLSAGEPSRGSSQRRRLPGKMCSSPGVFPPASLFLSTHLFSFSSRLYFKDDVRPSTSLPSPPLPSPPGRWISSAPWNRARNNKYLWVPGEGWTVNHHLSLRLLWKELALQNLH